MSIKKTFLILLFCFSTTYAQDNMIAEIKNDISTDFGIYHPYTVSIIPNSSSYFLEPDLSNVINHEDFNFNEDEKALLASNYFAVSQEGKRYNEIFDMYNDCRENGVPIFVTTDAMLHTFHLCFDFILQTVEQKRFISDLNSLLKEIIFSVDHIT